MSDISAWLEGLGLGGYTAVFAENHIDAAVLPDLAEADLEKLGLTLGHRKRLLRAIAELDGGVPAAAETAPQRTPAEEERGERRQLTVMFCDLADSTALSTRLDPEDLRDTIRAWQDTCRAVIARYDGFVAKYMGDGILVYFGYPRAHEDDAERAVRAGLGIVDAMGGAGMATAQGDDAALAVRIGIATGRVVVGDIIGEGASQEASVTGETPNLAARLQGIAAPDSVVIAPGTWRLAGGVFDYRDLGSHALKGFDDPVQARQVLGESGVETRFEARTGGLTQLTGRDEEVDMLLRRWRRAVDGDGQVVLVSGEAGIGKSRLIDTLRERIADEAHFRLRYQCSPHHANSALHPIIERLERAARFGRGDSDAAKLDKLVALLALAGTPDAATVALFADLLSLPVDDRYPRLEMTPRQKKQRTLEALAGQVTALAAHRPVLFAFEDAHWADPTTLELLDMIVEGADVARVVVLITHRPEFTAPWTGRPHTTLLALNRLGRRDCTAMCGRVTAGKALPDEVLAQIVEKTDGVPLFVEELTKTVLESGLLTEEPGRYTLAGPLGELAIPASLHDALMARLDRLVPVRQVAQTAAAIGRQFGYDLLARVSPLDEAALADALEQLAASELIFARGTPPDAAYTFKHALVQDAAYESLLRGPRRGLHARIAAALVEHFPATAEAEPGLLAHHYTEAGLAEPAADNWARAGRAAVERFAMPEAIEHFNRALATLNDIPDETERLHRELDVQIALAPTLMAVHDFGSEQPRRAFERARELSKQTDDREKLFGALWGLWLSYHPRGDQVNAQRLVHELLAFADRNQDPAYELQAHHAAWGGPFDARYEEDLAHIERGLALYDPAKHHAMATRFGGHDAGVCGLCHAALALWAIGRPDQAKEKNRQALALAQQLDHLPSLSHAGNNAAWINYYARNWAEVRRFAETAIEAGRESGYMVFTHQALALRGRALVELGEADAGLAAIDDNQVRLHAIGSMTALSFFTALYAEASAAVGQAEEALALLDQALEFSRLYDAGAWEPNTHRLKGEVLLTLAGDRQAEAEACFDASIAVARDQGAKMWELRASTSLARLWQAQGKTGEARDLLAPLYGWFSEGFDTADLKDAKALLDKLA